MPDRREGFGGRAWQRGFERRLASRSRLATFAQLRSVSPEPPVFVPGNEAVFLGDGRDQLAWMLAAIEHARSRVDLEMYIVQPDASGITIRDALVRAAERGVTVRVLWDAVGSSEAGEKFFEPIREAGGHVVEFHPVAPWRLRVGRIGHLQHWQPNARDHRKLLVCDAPSSFAKLPGTAPPTSLSSAEEPSGSLAITGGRNLGDEYLGRAPDDGQWRDAGVVLFGPVVERLGGLFDAMWFHAEGPDVSAPRLAAPICGNLDVMAIGSQPGFVNLLQWALSRMAFAVRRELRISCAYFIPSARWRKALSGVAARTGRCLVLLPKESDVPAVDAASRHLLGRLLRAGVRVHRHATGNLHEKTLLYDGVLTVVGSSNLDPRSFAKNYELSVLIVGEDFARPIVEMHEAGLARAEPYTLADWQKRTIFERFVDWLWSLLRSQL